MNSLRWLGLMAVMLGLGCSKEADVDVVNDAEPVSTAYHAIQGDLAQMATMTSEDRQRYVAEHFPRLHQGIVHFLRQRGKVTPNQQVREVEFRYGSLPDVQAESGSGETVRGHFFNQLLAVVHVAGVEKPIVVIVQCLNGIFELPGDALARLEMLGRRVPVERFVIGPGEGLVHHVDFQTAVDLAERHNLLLYRGRVIRAAALISPQQARAMEANTAAVQVTVFVSTGDAFDLVAGTYTPAARRQ